jgi:hypothetical protein
MVESISSVSVLNASFNALNDTVVLACTDGFRIITLDPYLIKVSRKI